MRTEKEGGGNKTPATCRRATALLRLPGNRFLIKVPTGAHPGGVAVPL